MAASDDQVPAKIQVSKLSYLAKILAALILDSYQNYALFFYLSFPVVSGKSISRQVLNLLILKELGKLSSENKGC